MGTTTDKLNAVLDSKEAIRQAIEYRGVDIPMDTTLAEYADKIGEIPTGGTLTDEQALVFIGECAEGKRKIAKALTQKYEPTNEYETFDEMAEKIKTLPLEIREDIPQPYFVVFNEMQKAFAKYGGEGVYCCSVELLKWSYDNDDKITLAEADAYYTSDGVYLTEGGEYQFQDIYNDNASRFVVYFYNQKDYTIPLNLNAAAVTNIYCLNGCPRFPIGNVYTNMFGIYSYTRDKYVVIDKNDLRFNELYRFREDEEFLLRYMSHVKQVAATTMQSYVYIVPDWNKYNNSENLLTLCSMYRSVLSIYEGKANNITDLYQTELYKEYLSLLRIDKYKSMKQLFVVISTIGWHIFRFSPFKELCKKIIEFVRK